MHVHPEKVTSTCSQRFAELDPHCPGMLLGACARFRAGAEACRLSLTCLRRHPQVARTLCRQSLRGVARLGQMVPKVRIWHEVSSCPWQSLPRRDSHDCSCICVVNTATVACSQATSTSTEHGGEAWNGLRGSPEVTPELAELSRRPILIHPHRLS